MAENYYESSVKKENQIEYADNIYLSKNILNNRENALNYFYTSPFYTSKSHMSLNEKIRIGKNIDDEEEGYLFDITYDNLSVLKINQPSDIVIQMFCIFNGKIYSSRSFGELLTNKINNIVRNIEKCYDCVDNMMNFNITSNYYFEAKEDNSQLDEVYRNYRLNDVHISTKKKQKRLHT